MNYTLTFPPGDKQPTDKFIASSSNTAQPAALFHADDQAGLPNPRYRQRPERLQFSSPDDWAFIKMTEIA